MYLKFFSILKFKWVHIYIKKETKSPFIKRKDKKDIPRHAACFFSMYVQYLLSRYTLMLGTRLLLKRWVYSLRNKILASKRVTHHRVL